jgi:hypothetical protein
MLLGQFVLILKKAMLRMSQEFTSEERNKRVEEVMNQVEN